MSRTVMVKLSDPTIAGKRRLPMAVMVWLPSAKLSPEYTQRNAFLEHHRVAAVDQIGGGRRER